MKKRLYRSTDSRVIAGVCGGMGEYFDVDPTWIRLLFVLLVFASGMGLIVYLIGWIVIPKSAGTAAGASQTGASTPPYPASASPAAQPAPSHGPGFLPGVILVALGMIFLFRRLFFWFDWDYIWPLVLIGLGGALVYRAVAPGRPEEASEHTGEKTVEVGDGSR